MLSQAAAREMLAPGEFGGWGMGLATGGTPAHRYFWHSGSNAGFKSMLFAYNEGEGAVVMTNSDSGEKLASNLMRTIAYEYGWPDFGRTKFPTSRHPAAPARQPERRLSSRSLFRAHDQPSGQRPVRRDERAARVQDSIRRAQCNGLRSIPTDFNPAPEHPDIVPDDRGRRVYPGWCCGRTR